MLILIIYMAGGTVPMVCVHPAQKRATVPLIDGTALTTIADLAQIDDTVAAQAEAIYPNTFVKAQQYNLQLQKEVDSSSLIHCHYGDHWPWLHYGHHGPRPHRTNGFLNECVSHITIEHRFVANWSLATTMMKVLAIPVLRQSRPLLT
jgi:hypothetical protein